MKNPLQLAFRVITTIMRLFFLLLALYAWRQPIINRLFRRRRAA